MGRVGSGAPYPIGSEGMSLPQRILKFTNMEARKCHFQHLELDTDQWHNFIDFLRWH